MNPHNIVVQIQYFASLREARGLSQEEVTVPTQTAEELFQNLKKTYGFTLESKDLRVALNGEFASMETPLSQGDRVVFIPPVAGG